MTKDKRPKLIPMIATSLIQPRIKKGWFSKPHVTVKSLVWCEAIAFERCGVLGILGRESRWELLEVLSFPRGVEKDLFQIIATMAEKMVLPHMEAPTILELVFREFSSKHLFDGDLYEFFHQFGDQGLPVERATESVKVWASLGAFVGIEMPERIKAWLQITYDPWSSLYGDDVAAILDKAVGERDTSAEQIIEETTDMFGEFCRDIYPEKVKDFDFI